MTIYFNKKKTRGITIPVSKEKAQSFLKRAILVLAILAAVLGLACLILALQMRWVRIEAGEQLLASDIIKNENAKFGANFDPDCVNHAGIYYFTVMDGDKSVDVRLKVDDTKAPQIMVKDVLCAVGGEYPKPEDFIESVYEPDAYVGEYVTALPEIKTMGVYKAQIRFTDASGNKTEIFDVKVTITVDIEPPAVETENEVTVFVGDCLELDVILTDNCIGLLTYTVDESEVDLNEEGSYTAYIVATDAIGNQSDPVKVKVNVILPEESEIE